MFVYIIHCHTYRLHITARFEWGSSTLHNFFFATPPFLPFLSNVSLGKSWWLEEKNLQLSDPELFLFFLRQRGGKGKKNCWNGNTGQSLFSKINFNINNQPEPFGIPKCTDKIFHTANGMPQWMLLKHEQQKRISPLKVLFLNTNQFNDIAQERKGLPGVFFFQIPSHTQRQSRHVVPIKTTILHAHGLYKVSNQWNFFDAHIKVRWLFHSTCSFQRWKEFRNKKNFFSPLQWTIVPTRWCRVRKG